MAGSWEGGASVGREWEKEACVAGKWEACVAGPWEWEAGVAMEWEPNVVEATAPWASTCVNRNVFAGINSC